MGKIDDETGPVTPNQTDKIREEIRSTEAGITDTIQNIEKRFAPAHIKAEAKIKAKEYSLMGFYKVTDVIRKKPVPAALIGVGLLYLLFRKKNRHPGRREEFAGTAMMEALPRKVKKDPVKAMKHYMNIARMAIAFGTAARAIYLQNKAMRETATHPHGRATVTVTEMPRAGAFPETVRETVY